jgi:hypothetical protein
MENILDTIIIFFQNNLIAGLIIAAVLIAVLIFRPGAVLKLFFIVLIFGIIAYAIALFTGSLESGTSEKDKLIHKTESSSG